MLGEQRMGNIYNEAQEVCKIMSRIYEGRLTTVSGGNISLMDSQGNIWITPSGGDKARYKEEDILKITAEGKVEGKGKPSVETEIHKALYAVNQNFKGVVHAHPPALVATSLIRKKPETMLIPKVANNIKNIQMAKYACPGTTALKDNVKKVFKENAGCNSAILENHGAFVASEYGLKEAFGLFEDLNLSISIQSKAMAFSGLSPKLITKEQMSVYNKHAHDNRLTCMPLQEDFREYDDSEKLLREKICDIATRAYKRKLMTQNIGVISARLNENTFVITQSNANKAELKAENLVKIKDGMAEKGKIPSKSVLLHKKIYDENPDINAIIMSAPENAMVFAVTDLEYDLKTIPECYIVLRERIEKFPFGSTISRKEELSEYFKQKSPVAIIENDCYICTGSSLFNAFDKLEVIEFSTQAVIQAKELGGIITPITEDEVLEIKTKFGII